MPDDVISFETETEKIKKKICFASKICFKSLEPNP